MDPFLLIAAAEGYGPGIVAPLLDPELEPERLLADPPRNLPPAARARLRDRRSLEVIAREWMRDCANRGVEIVTPRDDDYPAVMRDTPLRPAVLFVVGDAALLREGHRGLAVVGSRTPTAYGRAAARDFAQAAGAHGIALWSGLATGIDAIAHECCVDSHSPTVAVLAGGFDHVYPASHHGLFDQIVATGGACVSELPPGMRPRRGHFPRRNRILAFATGAVLVVEAGLASGTLHTARWAVEAGANVFAVPGPYTSERSRGCHRLLADGAAIACDPESLLRDLGVRVANRDLEHSAECSSSADEVAIGRTLALGPRPAELVRRESRLDNERYFPALLRMLESGRLIQLPGGVLANAHYSRGKKTHRGPPSSGVGSTRDSNRAGSDSN